MFSKNSSLLTTISHILVYASLVMGVLLVLPITDGFLFTTKLFMMFAITILLGFAFVVYSVQRKTIELVLSPFTVPLILFGLAVMASTFFTNNYPIEALFNLGGVYIAMVLFVLFASTLTNKGLVEKILPVAGITGAALTVLSVAQSLGFGPAHMFNQIMKLNIQTDLGFNLTGAPLFALQFLLVVAVGMIVQAIVKKHISRSTAILFPILLCGIAIFGWSLLPGKPGSFPLPSWAASWSVALDTIRSPRAALIGGGPASYVNLYSRFKPVWVNSTPEWSLAFSQASNFPLTLLTTTGFLGLITWLLLGYQSLRVARKTTGTTKAVAYMLLATFILQLLMPTNIVILIFQAVLFVAVIAGQYGHLPILRFQALTMSMDNQASSFHTPTQKVSFPIYFTAAILTIGLVLSSYMVGRAYAASNLFFRASLDAQNQDVVGLYEKQQRVVQLNPYLDLYRRQYAVTNLVIASSLSKKTDITDAEKEQVGQLLQQGVREARSATLLDPLDTENIAVLAQIYQNMIGIADQADQFAVQTYLQAIQSEPTNPALRVSLGQLLVGQKQLQQAASVFSQAVDIKPDYPNSYYNLAVTLHELGAVKESQAAYQALLKLLPADSEEAAQVAKELEVVDKKVAELVAKEEAEAKKNGTATGQTDQSKSTPSLLDQNLNEGANDVINNPSDADLKNPPETTDLGQELQATPTPTPASNPTP